MAAVKTAGGIRRRATAKPIKRPAPLSELALDRLRADIVSGVFAFGERLSEDQLSNYYGLTRAPIRTALLHLQSDGLIQILPQKGGFVFDPTPNEVRSLCELRAALEIAACRLALERNPAKLAKDISALVEAMRPYADTIDNPRYQELDSALHSAILSASDSPMLVSTYERLVHWRFAALRTRLARDREHANRSFGEHERIRDLIIAGDRDGLIAAVETHIRNTNIYYDRLLVRTDG